MSNLLLPQTYSELERWAAKISKTEMVPKAYRGKPDDIIVCVQYGQEIGLGFMESLKSIAVINGNPSVYGDGLLAICQRHPEFEDLIETPELNEKGEVTAYIAQAIRKGHTTKVQRFTQADAIRAKLWGKAGPWTEYPQRMLQMRARGFALRDQFSDILKGLLLGEEAGDYPTIDGEPAVLTSDQINQLVNLLEQTKTERSSFLTTMFTGVNSLEEIPAGEFDRAFRTLTKKKEAMKTDG